MRLLMIALAVSMFAIIACTQIKKPPPRTLDSTLVVVQRVVSVYDADTFRVSLKDWPEYLGDDISIRVRGIDAPEIRGKCESEKVKARAARDYVRQRLSKSSTISLHNIEPGKYFRLVADVQLDGTSLAQELINQGLARSYDGGHRQGWCDAA